MYWNDSICWLADYYFYLSCMLRGESTPMRLLWLILYYTMLSQYLLLLHSQQTWPTLVYCWVNVVDGGPTVNQRGPTCPVWWDLPRSIFVSHTLVSSSCFHSGVDTAVHFYSVVQSQKAVFADFTSTQILSFGSAEHYCSKCYQVMLYISDTPFCQP